MRPKTWLLRRLAELVVFVGTVAVANGLQVGSLSSFAETTVPFVLNWATYYGVFSGYWIISAILFATFRRSEDPRTSPAIDSLALVIHSYAAVSVVQGWPVGFGAGLDLRSPAVAGWGAVLLLHALLLVRTLVARHPHRA
jgi:L-lactate permease